VQLTYLGPSEDWQKTKGQPPYGLTLFYWDLEIDWKCGNRRLSRITGQ
jgi:hypothetical protein